MTGKSGRMRSLPGMGMRRLWIMPAFLLAVVLILAGTPGVASAGPAAALLHANGSLLAGSILDTMRLPVNGVEQGLLTRGQNILYPLCFSSPAARGCPDTSSTASAPPGPKTDSLSGGGSSEARVFPVAPLLEGGPGLDGPGHDSLSHFPV